MNLRIAMVKACEKHGFKHLAMSNSASEQKYADGYATPVKLMQSFKRNRKKQE